jgi:hypothetical protein
MDNDSRAIGTTADDENPSTPPATVAPDALLARFRSSQTLDDAITRLEAAGFGREDMGLPDIAPPAERNTPEAGSKAAETDAEDHYVRVFHSSVGGSFAALMAAAAVAATGGAVAAIAGVAIGVGAAVAGAANLLHRALSHSEQIERDRRAAEGRLILAVRVPTPDRRRRAEAAIRDTGGEIIV